MSGSPGIDKEDNMEAVARASISKSLGGYEDLYNDNAAYYGDDAELYNEPRTSSRPRARCSTPGRRYKRQGTMAFGLKDAAMRSEAT